MKIFKNRVVLLVIIIIIFVTVLISSMIYLKSVSEYKQKVQSTTFDEINISDISDGIYIGEYDVNFIYAKVKVSVKNGKIVDIDILEHKNGRGKSAESIINKIVDEQKINVDAISSATNSSIVIKKAVENALRGENQ